MAFGTSSGEQHDSLEGWMIGSKYNPQDYHSGKETRDGLDRPLTDPPGKDTDQGFYNHPGDLGGTSTFSEPFRDLKDKGGILEKVPTSQIDREHHVPLVASALTDDNGQMYGMAIDHRIPPKPEYEKHLWQHEAYENEYMNHLVKIGYSSQDAYHKAHDWSTARESAAVEAEFGKDGLEDYKQHWRDASKIASEPSDRDRHPDAHTTRHGLDESELGVQLASADGSRTITEATIEAFQRAMRHFRRAPDNFVHEIVPPIPGGRAADAEAARDERWRQAIQDAGRRAGATSREQGPPQTFLEQAQQTPRPNNDLEDIRSALQTANERYQQTNQATSPQAQLREMVRQELERTASKVKVAATNAPPPKSIKLTHDPRFPSTSSKYWNFIDEEGKSRGYINLSVRGDDLHVNMVENYGNRDNQGMFMTNPELTKSLLEQIRKEYPNAKTISGYRISGARGVNDTKQKIKRSLVDLSRVEDKYKTIRSPRGWSRTGDMLPGGYEIQIPQQDIYEQE
jgi:hypothetical protein